MAPSGKFVKIEAPCMIVDRVPVWMDRYWLEDFHDWLHKENIKINGWKILQNKLKIEFTSAKMATVFGLKYDDKAKQKIFRSTEWS